MEFTTYFLQEILDEVKDDIRMFYFFPIYSYFSLKDPI